MANPTEVVLSPSGRHTHSIGFFERLPLVAGGAVACIGVLVLLGWYLALPTVTSWMVGGIPMIPLTAVCFTLSGISLVLAVLPVR
ncbi:MAG: hypothetical protein ACREMY_23295, partial [bacterium]